LLEEEEVPVEDLRKKEEEEEEFYRKQEELLREQYNGETEETRSNIGSSYHAPVVGSLEGAIVPVTNEAPSHIQFNPSAILDPPTFERTWKTLPLAKKHQSQYLGSSSDPQKIDSFFNSHNIKSVAKGASGGVLRFFLYAQEIQSAALFLIELVINLGNKQVTANIKSTHEHFVGQFEVVFQGLLQQL